MFPLVLIETIFPWRQSDFPSQSQLTLKDTVERPTASCSHPASPWFLETTVAFQPLEVGHTVASHF